MSQNIFANPYVSSAPALTGPSVGDGTLTIDRLTHFTITQDYTVICTAISPFTVFKVVGSLDGSVGVAVVGTQFYDEDLKIFLTIEQGPTLFEIGDTFELSTAEGVDVNRENIDLYDELAQKNFGQGVAGTLSGDHNLRFNLTGLDASKIIQDLSFTSLLADKLEGNEIDIQYLVGSLLTSAFLLEQDATYTVTLGGIAGNDYTMEYLDWIPGEYSAKTIQDIHYTAVDKGVAGDSITITYTGGGTAGSEIASVIGTDIDVIIEDGVSDVTEIRTALLAVPAIVLLINASATGTGLEVQSVQTITALEGGEDTVGDAGNEVVSISVKAITIRLQHNNSTAQQVVDAFNAEPSVNTLLSAAVSGTAGNVQTAPVAEQPFAGGLDDVGDPGNEIVEVITDKHIQVRFVSGVSTATQIKAAIDGHGPAAALVAVGIPGTAGNFQLTPTGPHLLRGGRPASTYSINTKEITDVAAFYEGNASILVKDLITQGNLIVIEDAKFNKAVAIDKTLDVVEDATFGGKVALQNSDALDLSGASIPDAQKSINDLIDNLMMVDEHVSNKKRVEIRSLTKILADGTIIEGTLQQLLVAFSGAEIDFTTGVIYKEDGVSALGVNFTPPIIPSGEYNWVAITLIPNAANPDGTMSAQIAVAYGDTTDVDSVVATKPALSIGLPLAYLLLKGDGVNIVDIAQADIYQMSRGSGGGGGGAGDITALEVRMGDLLDDSFYEFLDMNIFVLDEDEKVESATGTLAASDGVYQFQIGENLISKEHLDPEYLTEGNDILKAQLVAVFEEGNIDSAPDFEMTNNGVDYESITMAPLSPANNTFIGELEWDLDALVLQTLHEYAYGNADANLVLNDGTTEERSQEFDITQHEVATELNVQITKTGSPLGYAYITLYKDNAGDPGIMFQQVQVDITALAAGLNTVNVNVGRTRFLDTGKYHLSVMTSPTYKASFDTGVDEISLRADSSAPTIADCKVFTASVWADVVGSSIVHKIEGHALSVFVKYTAGSICNLKGYGVFYGTEMATIQGIKKRDVFVFDGTLDKASYNLGFDLSFNGDVDLIEVVDVYVGQTFLVPAFAFANNKVTFDTDFWDGRGEVFLIIRQMESVQIDATSEALNLLAENKLGSSDPALSRAVAGEGPKVLASDSVMVSITVDEFRNIVIKEA